MDIPHRGGFTFKVKTLCIFIAVAVFSMPASTLGEEETSFSYGPGPVEVFIFSDYFCPPCQGVEPYLESVLPSLPPMGAKITFIDMPLYEKTPIYSRYFLYAAKASGSFDEVLRIRNVLFELAKTKAVSSSQEMMRRFQEKKIGMNFFDNRPIFNKWREAIARFDVKSTPTCVVVKPGEDALKYKGGFEIRNGIESLLKELSEKPPKE